MSYAELRQEAEDYYRLCEKAEAVGVPTSLDDPDAPATVEELREAVAAQTPVWADLPPGTSGSRGEA